MRKKSHISLARYLVRQHGQFEMFQHKKAFYLGSILPDLNPAMVAAPHEYETSYENLKEDIRELTEGWRAEYSPRAFWRKLGIIMHYLADYFTFPHNVSFDGSLKDHCIYEGELKHWLRRYVHTAEAKDIFRAQKFRAKQMNTAEELFHYIEVSHAVYMREKHSVESDCRWIVEICSQVLVSVVYLMEQSVGTSTLGIGVQVA